MIVSGTIFGTSAIQLKEKPEKPTKQSQSFTKVLMSAINPLIIVINYQVI